MADTSIVPTDQVLPVRLYLLPVTGRPFFPGALLPLVVSTPPDLALVEKSLETGGFLGLILTQREDAENPVADDLHRVGTAAKVLKRINLPQGGINLIVNTVKRFHVAKYLSKESPISAAVQYMDDTDYEGMEVQALTRALLVKMKEVAEANPLLGEHVRLDMVNIDQPGKLADFVTSILNAKRDDQQKILEATNVRHRMESVLVFIQQEHELLKLQKKIQDQINEKISKAQREYFLKEQLKAIKAELGMAVDAKSEDFKRFKDIYDGLALPEEAQEKMGQELEKFSLMDPNSSEFIVTRNYLDTVLTLPWKPPQSPEIDLAKARRILDEDHYGLDDVKERILEYLSVRKLRKDTKGSIICLAGPPGVGKTSVGRSIARALGRPFFRFSVGGMRDEAEIKGHRRTYVGAMPGKIMQGLKIVKTRAPVFMIDEIDKLGASYQGDPSSALLEVLDPEQNVSFRDHYVDLPFDVSDILFITTANTLDSIPLPLLDRMEVIRLSGYINEEKVAIARRYLIPKSTERNGLGRRDVRYPGKTLLAIADGYAREAGVRNFEKALDRIHRKIARRSFLEGIDRPVSVNPEDLSDYLGKPPFEGLQIEKATRPGNALGLAWTPLGGEVLVIEAVSNPGTAGLKLTGKMGEVMQESANIAYTYVRHMAEHLDVEPAAFDKNLIHLHIPAGATPKDGPSAGITMASCLLSLVTGRRIKPSLAMTGELSLTGKVLPIGGLKEKTIAAKRNKIRDVIIPDDNGPDLDEIPEHVRKGITFHRVRSMDEVVEIIFPARAQATRARRPA
jgi:ATP-dependent Lon protease